ncbi:hypothetical protein [Nocardia sp. NPDC050710]|uniref:hypothetical protein n=1 Tax=Nocardia sp. NPDC050710 TaxID=3157220 RepID=UPI003406E2AF
MLILTALVPVLLEAISELFWLRALNKPGRSLYRILKHAASIGEAERLMRLLRYAQRDVLDARVKTRRAPRR